MAEAAKWYVVHTYSGYENTVKATIEKTVESRQLQDQILAISIPLETVTEITDVVINGKTYDATAIAATPFSMFTQTGTPSCMLVILCVGVWKSKQILPSPTCTLSA